ncbi:hypothetical protein L3Q82_021256 [Scortum barcoo]|uniref:Uncharacterized protein n=1 Tax=Scortum barcoo TaxID=214431 RepID=A0ACB8X3P6_9TELE|nr:hypothetical protein L3Q82_021256 [Scortum barcoo]
MWSTSSRSRMAVFIVMLTLTYLFSTTALVTGEPRAVCPNPIVEAVEGHSVSLPCHLDPPDNVVNNAVDWKRTDANKVVWAYRNKKENLIDQIAEYRGRVTVNLQGLNIGNMTLLISSVKKSDAGPYRCFTSKLRTGCNLSLIFVPRDQQNGTKLEDFSTTTPPTHEPDEPGAENMKRVRYIILLVVGVFFIIVIVALVIRGMNNAES